jgi:hypothetical protein
MTIQDCTKQCMRVQVAMNDALQALPVTPPSAGQLQTCRASRLGHNCMLSFTDRLTGGMQALQ